MYTYLALGDSYTIGEQVPPEDNFPNQTVTLLRKDGVDIADPKIIAVTGWTTDELAAGIEADGVMGTFDVVTLLIGVNNQYRGRDIENYKPEFTALLEQAIAFAGGNTSRVFVLSIPDWGATPFAEEKGSDKLAVAKGIDEYNAAKKEITEAHHCTYIEITESTREHANDAEYLVGDNLHPSGKEYAIWAERLAPLVKKSLQ